METPFKSVENTPPGDDSERPAHVRVVSPQATSSGGEALTVGDLVNLCRTLMMERDRAYARSDRSPEPMRLDPEPAPPSAGNAFGHGIFADELPPARSSMPTTIAEWDHMFRTLVSKKGLLTYQEALQIVFAAEAASNPESLGPLSRVYGAMIKLKEISPSHFKPLLNEYFQNPDRDTFWPYVEVERGRSGPRFLYPPRTSSAWGRGGMEKPGTPPRKEQKKEKK